MGALLQDDEESPFIAVNGQGRSPYVLICEHASNLIPKQLGTLGLAQAEIVEEVVDVPVSVVNAYGLKVEHPIKVTVFRETSRDRSPYLVLNHGRPASEADFAQMKRQRFSALSRYFVGLGFTVLVPTRVGYGDTGGPDVEHSGRCDSRNYPPVYAAAADETEQLLGALARHPGVSLERGLVVGQSFGGLTTLALSARRLPGLVAGVNFAGGGSPEAAALNPATVGALAPIDELRKIVRSELAMAG